MAEAASTLALGTLGLAVLLIAFTSVWQRTVEPFVVLFEQLGHAVTILLSGRWIQGIELQRNQKGETFGSTRHNKEADGFRPPLIVFRLAGYSAPPIAGLVLARGVDRGWDPGVVLATLLVIVGVLALFHEKRYTLVVIAGVALLLAAFFWRAEFAVQMGAVVTISWVLLIGGLRRGLYLLNKTDNRTDATALQDLTGIHENMWIAWFIFVAVASLVVGARWLLTSA